MKSSIDSTNPIIVVQGAQWGSEAKGAVTAALTMEEDCDIAVRTGTVNAGHTVIYNGFAYAMQQIPVSWISPNCQLYIGPGAYIHPEVLANEIHTVRVATGEDIRNRLWIDFRCGLHLPYHTDRAKTANRHHKMGATGKGCSEAVIAKIAGRGTVGGELFQQWLDRTKGPGRPQDHGELLDGLQFTDTVRLLNSSWDEGAKVIIEGTQGTLLDLHTGPYPYTTHKQTLPGNWIAEAGLSPSLPYEVALVVRTYPIRVAGNSGPMPGETSWPVLARAINRRLAKFNLPPRVQEDSIRDFEEACEEEFEKMWTGDGHRPPEPYADLPTKSRIENWTQAEREAYPVICSELHARALDRLSGPVIADLRNLFELTTVTKKLRRVAKLDLKLLAYSVMLNRPAYLVVTFINHLFPETWDKDLATMPDSTRAEVAAWVVGLERQLEQRTGFHTPVMYVSTGPGTKRVQHRDAFMGDLTPGEASINAAIKGIR